MFGEIGSDREMVSRDGRRRTTTKARRVRPQAVDPREAPTEPALPAQRPAAKKREGRADRAPISVDRVARRALEIAARDWTELVPTRTDALDVDDRLSKFDAAILIMSDGSRTIQEIASAAEISASEVVLAVSRLERRGALEVQRFKTRTR